MYSSAVVLLLCSVIAGSWAQASLFGYGTARGDRRLPTCDDCTSGVQRFRYGSARYYGRNYECYAAHSNGYMTLPTTGRVRSYSYNPSALSGVRGDPLIAAYWADVDLRGVGAVHYRETCSSADLNAAATHIRCRYGGSYRPTSAVVTTWEGVGYYGRHTNKRNTFQVVIAKGGSQTYLIFLYRQIQWTTGDASGGRNGLGGRVAQVGYSSANGMGSMSLPGTGTSAVCNLPSLSNNGFRGVFVFRVHGGDLMDVQSLPQPIDEFAISTQENVQTEQESADQVEVNKENLVQAMTTELEAVANVENHPEKVAYEAGQDPPATDSPPQEVVDNEEYITEKQEYEAMVAQGKAFN